MRKILFLLWAPAFLLISVISSCSDDGPSAVNVPVNITFTPRNFNNPERNLLLVNIDEVSTNLVEENLTPSTGLSSNVDGIRRNGDLVTFYDRQGFPAAVVRDLIAGTDQVVDQFCPVASENGPISVISTNDRLVTATVSGTGELSIEQYSFSGNTCQSLALPGFNFVQFDQNPAFLATEEAVLFIAQEIDSPENLVLFSVSLNTNEVFNSLPITSDERVTTNGQEIIIFNTQDSYIMHNSALAETTSGSFNFTNVENQPLLFETQFVGDRFIGEFDLTSPDFFSTAPVVLELGDTRTITFNDARGFIDVVNNFVESNDAILTDVDVDLSRNIFVAGIGIRDPELLVGVGLIGGRILYGSLDGSVLAEFSTARVPTEIFIR